METTSPARANADRIAALDIIRGVAVIGILLMNITSFAMPMGAYFNPLAWGTPGTADLMTFALNFVLVDGKMRGLFSLLFGASMTLVIDRANHRMPGSGAGVHLRRMAILALFGLAHYYLIWAGDILFLYAATGTVALLFMRRSAASLIRAALFAFITAFLLSLLFIASFYLMQFHAQASGGTEALRDFNDMLDGIGAPGSQITGEEVVALRGSYADALGYRFSPAMAGGPFTMLWMSGIETLAYMLAGAGLMRSGFFEGQWGAERYRTIARNYGLPALVALVILVAQLWRGGFDTLASFAAFFSWSVPFDWMMTFAYAALLVLAVERWRDTWLAARLAAAGRAAFTNYLGTSIVMTSLFYGYGLGWFGTVARWQLPLFVAAMAVLMLAWSKPWLDRFHYGPLEWAWRSLARGSLQPFRRDHQDKAN